jgi:hypothetical protein
MWCYMLKDFITSKNILNQAHPLDYASVCIKSKNKEPVVTSENI